MQQLIFRSQIFHMEDLTIHTVKEVQLKAKLQDTVTWSVAAQLSHLPVITHLCSSAKFVSLHSRTHKEKFCAYFKNVIPIFVSTFFFPDKHRTALSPTLRNLKLR